jgi:ppGpp synthetase/RelA/SpoT-type nucleotidyltranferase
MEIDKTMNNGHLEHYAKKRDVYQSFCREVKRIIDSSFEQIKFRTHSIDARAKEVDSFERKLKKVTEGGHQKYLDPMREITDLAGVRVIVYTIDEIKTVASFVDENFEVIERRDVGEERLEKGQFGYQSIHYLIRLPVERLNLPDYSHFKEMICEIQIRTVLQHAWAEMEHDIQYKGSENIPKSIKRKFLSLAGLLEIADREFSSIQREDKKLKEGVLTELQVDLTRDAVTRPSRVADCLNASAPSQDQLGSGAQVRELLATGQYHAAISVYNEKIQHEPTSYTLYLGRARAYFLTGETKLALKDIDQAETYKPEDPAVILLRSKISDGSLSPPQESQNKGANDTLHRGHAAFIAGEPVEAFALYSDAQKMGASWPFTTFYMALACAVSGDLPGADLLLDKLAIHPGTPMEINIMALRAILLALRDSDNISNELDEIRDRVLDKGDFMLEISPLNLLKKIDQEGLWGEKSLKIREVLEALDYESPQ